MQKNFIYLFMIILLIGASHSNADEKAKSNLVSDQCIQSWAKQDQAEKEFNTKTQVCQLKSRDSSAAVQVVLIKGTCNQYSRPGAEAEGDQPDCIFIRECGGDGDSMRSSRMIFNNKGFLKRLCEVQERGERSMLELKKIAGGKESISAAVLCPIDHSRPRTVKVTVGNLSKDCQIPF